MITAKFSQHFEAVRSRIKRLPVLLTAEVEAQALKDAERMRELFKEGIKRRELNLKQLKSATIASKQRKGYTAPENPLYGTNRKKNRYNNMLEVVRFEKKWVVRPRKEKHWHASISLAVMFDVHEYGATIMGKSRNGGSVRIRIPPRPAFRNAYNKLLRERLMADPAQIMREKIAEYIQKGNWRAQKRQQKKDVE